MAANLPIQARLIDNTYTLSPTGNPVDDTAAWNSLIDAIPAGKLVGVKIRDNGQPLRLGVVGASPTPKSIIGKGMFFRGETPNAKIIWGVGSGTGVNGLYNLNFGGYTSPLNSVDSMPSHVTRGAMSAAMTARDSVGSSVAVSLAKGDRVMIWSDDDIASGAHDDGGKQRPGELHRVEYVSGSDFYLDNWIVDAMSLNMKIAKIQMQKGCGFADLQFGYEGPPLASRIGGYNYIDVRYCQDFVMENIRVDENGVGTLVIHACDRPRFINYSADYMNWASDYGVQDMVNRDLVMHDCHWRFMRHLHTTSGVYDPSKMWAVTITGTGGTWSLTYGGQTTANINHNDNAATVQARLSALSNVPDDELVVTGTPSRFIITAVGSLRASSTSLMTLNRGNLTGEPGPSPSKIENICRYGNSRSSKIRYCKTSLAGDAGTTIAYGFALHHEGYEVEYDHCEVEIGGSTNPSTGLSHVGFESRARKTIWKDCTVKGATHYDSPSVLRINANGWEIRSSDCEMHRCKAENVYRGIQVAGDFYGRATDRLLVDGFIADRCTGNGLNSSTADTGYGVFDEITVKNSTFKNCCEFVGASDQGADIRVTRGTGHRFYFNQLIRDTNRYSFSFEALTAANMEILGNICRNYANFGTNRLGIRGVTGDPHLAVEASADLIQSTWGASNYTTA
jgi:hypothetical protein